MINKKAKILSILMLIFVTYQLAFFDMADTVRSIEVNVNGFKYQGKVDANQTITYYFNNSIELEIYANIDIDNFSLDYEDQVQNRQIYLSIINNESISLNMTSKKAMNHFILSKIPKEPEIGGHKLQDSYRCVYNLYSNQSVEKLTIQYKKNNQFGLKINSNYIFSLIKASQDSWELVNPVEKINQLNSEPYLEISLLNLEGDTSYFFTLYEINDLPGDWSWLAFTVLLLVLAGVISLIVVVSKDDFLNYIKTRTTSIDKGAHHLSLDEVLENENREKIIDIILDEPGIHFNDLLRKMGLAAGNLVWHLEILNKYKIIGKKAIGRYVAYFPYYPKNPISNLDLKLQKSKLTLQILELIENEPGIWNSILKKKLNVDHKTIYYHTSKLIDLNLIITKKEGRKKKFYPNLDSDYYSNKNSFLDE